MSRPTSASAVMSLMQLGGSLYANRIDREAAAAEYEFGQGQARRQRLLQTSGNEASAAKAGLQRWIQSYQTQRAQKQAAEAGAAAQGALAALQRAGTAADFGAQLAAARESGAAAAAASGVAGVLSPVQAAQELALGRERRRIADEAAAQTYGLEIKARQAAEAGPLAGDLAAILPGLDRSVIAAPGKRYVASALETGIGWFAGLSGDSKTDLLSSLNTWGGWVADEYRFRTRGLAPDGMEDR